MSAMRRPRFQFRLTPESCDGFIVGALGVGAFLFSFSWDGDPLSPPWWLAIPGALLGGIMGHFMYKHRF